jgi:hypothetical protein
MTKDEVIEMARKAGFSEWAVGLSEMPLHLEAFAKLVEERTIELCAKVCEKWTPTDADGVCDVANAIREILNTEETV